MANSSEGVYVFPDAMTKGSGIDPGLLALLNNGGGFGNNGYWIWILFMWMIWGGNGNWGNGIATISFDWVEQAKYNDYESMAELGLIDKFGTTE